mmetsp:Transcript_148794/g.414558  ORF Transcript_148794/g.414558 Transcript_148794/m.414558 type:complete len:97 (+) Transcript_148794:1097-1387(+)
MVVHMGLFDKGKTFLINHLYGKNLPSDKLHETTGFIMYVSGAEAKDLEMTLASRVSTHASMDGQAISFGPLFWATLRWCIARPSSSASSTCWRPRP